jgi:hypothetical protein
MMMMIVMVTAIAWCKILTFVRFMIGSKIKMPTINFKKFVANDSIGEMRTNGQPAGHLLLLFE